MTVGTTTRDQRVNYTIYNGSDPVGTGLTGFYSERSWSGGDRPAGRTYQKRQPIYSTEQLIRVNRKGESIPYLWKRRVYTPSAPPSRGRRDAEHTYTALINQYTSPVVKFQYYSSYYGWDTATYTRDLVEYYSPGPDNTNITSNDIIRVLGKLRERVAGSDFNAGVFLGEGKEAIGMIFDSARRIYGALHAFRRGHIDYAARILTQGTDRAPLHLLHKDGVRRATASNWLELQYGWLPLLKDAESAAIFLSHHFSVPLQHTVKVGTKTKASVQSGTISTSVKFIDAGSFNFYSIKAILKEKNVIALSGLMDPLSVAWELVPYSFVADWFIPIGNYLSARGLAQALTGTFVTSSGRFRKAKGLEYAISTQRFVEPVAGFRYQFVDISRTVSTTLSVPMPSIKPLSDVPSWKRAANSVALLVNAFR